MSQECLSFDLSQLPPAQSYELLTRAVQPRPIAFVSTIGTNGVLNLAPFSFFMAGGSNPPSLCFSATLTRNGSEKDSLRNIRETGEFVVNSIQREMVNGMNATSAPFGPDESEWEVSGFTPLASLKVKPPRVAESMMQMECRLFEVLNHGDSSSSARYIVGEVVAVHIHSALAEDGSVDWSKYQTVARLGGADYLDSASFETFSLSRP